jgi:hypothetical protein
MCRYNIDRLKGSIIQFPSPQKGLYSTKEGVVCSAEVWRLVLERCLRTLEHHAKSFFGDYRPVTSLPESRFRFGANFAATNLTFVNGS